MTARAAASHGSMPLLFLLLAACAADADPDLYGPANSWFHADADVVQGGDTGFEQGDLAPNLPLVDQFGDSVELHQFWGKIVVLDVFAEWCVPCRDHAPDGEDLWLEADGDVVIFAAMQQNIDTSPASAAGVSRWVDDFELSHPVLADPAHGYRDFAQGGFPTYVVLGRDLRILDPDLYPFDSDWVLSQR